MNSRPLIIVVLLLVCLGLIGVLGWQSWQLQRSNDAVARSVQRDYATLAADEYGRRLTAALGYRGFFQIVSRFGDPADAAELRASLLEDEQLADALDLIDSIFVVSSNGASFDGSQIPAELRSYLEALHERASHLSGPYLAIPAGENRPQLVYTWSADQQRVLGFTANALGVANYLRGALDMEPLLPASLGDGNVGNDRLFVEVLDGTGTTLMTANSPFDYAEVIEKVMGDDYQGVVKDFQIRVAVDPAIASALLIGGLPADRVPFLVIVLVLAIALMLTAIWLFRREHAVMRMRTEFVSQVSHELRTPLTQIRMFAETLLLNRTRSDTERTRALQVIDRESRRLSHLVENILRFSSRVDSVSLSPRLQPIAPIVREVCEATRMSSPDVTIDVQVDDVLLAVVDDDALRQILLNLLDNAIKYGPTEQTISLTAFRLDGNIQIEVVDEGPGIPRSEREQVWNPFYRLAVEQRTAISGTGIGLAVVRDLIKVMQGRCWIAEPATGKGTAITMQLPGQGADE